MVIPPAKTTVEMTDSHVQQKRSRWGAEPEAPPVKKSRWGAEPDTLLPPANGALVPSTKTSASAALQMLNARGNVSDQLAMLRYYTVLYESCNHSCTVTFGFAAKSIQINFREAKTGVAHAPKLVLDNLGRELDEQGKVIPMKAPPVATLKINQKKAFGAKDADKAAAVRGFFIKSCIVDVMRSLPQVVGNDDVLCFRSLNLNVIAFF